MGNNPLKEAGAFPPLFFSSRSFLVLLICILLQTELGAQKLSRYYVSFKTTNGTLYFIRPQNMYRSATGHFSYDITASSQSDSLTLNFSYYDPAILEPDSLILGLGSKKCGSPLSKLFVESGRKNWHYRMSARFSMKDTEAFFAQSDPPSIQISCKEKSLSMSAKTSKWKKYAPLNMRIFHLIRLNK